MTLPAGTILSQRYELQSFVGSDGTLDVYRSLDLRLGRDVAVTVLEIRHLNDPLTLLRFEKEAQLRASLQHARIMTIHDFGHDGVCTFQVAEWLDGQSLRKRLKTGRLDWTETMAVGKALLEGLDAIHQKGFTLNVLDESSAFLERRGDIKLFAYSLSALDTLDAEGMKRIQRDRLQDLARLLLRVSGEAPDRPAQTMDRAALRRLAERPDGDAATLRRGLLDLFQNAPARRASRRWMPWAATVGVVGVAVLFSPLAERLRAPRPAAPQPVAPPDAPPDGSDARRLCLYGLQLLDNRDGESLRRAQTYLQGAISRDPSYALAHNGLADCYGYLGMAGVLPRDQAMQLSLASAQRALELDPSLGSAHASLAFTHLWYGLAWKRAEKDYRQALSLSPDHPGTLHGYGLYLASTGRAKEGLEQVRKALERAPLSASYRTSFATLLSWSGYAREAEDEFAKAMDQAPACLETLTAYREALEQLGRFEKALQISDRLAELGGISQQDASSLRSAFEARGAHGYLNERLRELEQDRWAEPVQLARLAMLAGDRERALRLLTRAVREKTFGVPRIPMDAVFAPLHGDPRYARLLKGLGLAAS